MTPITFWRQNEVSLDRQGSLKKKKGLILRYTSMNPMRCMIITLDYSHSTFTFQPKSSELPGTENNINEKQMNIKIDIKRKEKVDHNNNDAYIMQGYSIWKKCALIADWLPCRYLTSESRKGGRIILHSGHSLLSLSLLPLFIWDIFYFPLSPPSISFFVYMTH